VALYFLGAGQHYKSVELWERVHSCVQKCVSNVMAAALTGSGPVTGRISIWHSQIKSPRKVEKSSNFPSNRPQSNSHGKLRLSSKYQYSSISLLSGRGPKQPQSGCSCFRASVLNFPPFILKEA
jgi:hypothetical protein